MTNPQRVVDFRLPLSAILSATCSVAAFMVWMGWTAAQTSSKIDQVVTSNTKLEQRLNERDQRLEALREATFEMRRATDMNTLRISNLESSKK